MGKLDKNNIEHLAKLSNLTIQPNDTDDYSKSLSESLEYIENLEDISTDSVAEDFFTTTARNVMRRDVLEKERMLTQEEALSNAHSVKKSSFVVKRIL